MTHFDRAQRVLPGGVSSPVRAFGAVGGEPRFITRGDGPWMYDTDGRRLIDLVGSWGPLILGHAHPAVVEAAERAIRNGSTFGAPTVAEVDLAEAIRDAMPSVQMLRFVSSGTEATMSALRLARAATGRDRIVKFAGCYHGHVDALLVQAGSGVATLGLPDSPGIPRGTGAGTIVVPYNNAAAVAEAFEHSRGLIAAIIVEPIAANMGVVPPAPGFLSALRSICEDHGALLIFDEVVTGFRVARGGAQTLFGVTPDITVLGKVVGGGLPAAAYGGRAELMRLVAPAGPVYQAGTLSGNPVAMAAGLATLQALDDQAYKTLETLGADLEARFAAAAEGASVPISIQRVGSMLTAFFGSHPVTDLPSAKAADATLFAKFFHAMLTRDVYLPPSQLEAAFVSLAHTPAEIAEIADAAAGAFKEIA